MRAFRGAIGSAGLVASLILVGSATGERDTVGGNGGLLADACRFSSRRGRARWRFRRRR